MRDEADLGAQALQVDGACVDAVDLNAAAGRLVEAGQQVDERGLADAAGADDGDHLTRLRDQIDAVQDGGALFRDEVAVSVDGSCGRDGPALGIRTIRRWYGRGFAVQRVSIFELHTVVADQAMYRWEGGEARLLLFPRRLEDLKDTPRGAECFTQLRVEPGKLADRSGHHEHVEEEGDQFAGCDRTCQHLLAAKPEHGSDGAEREECN